uniref:NADH dehydrogenase subunit 2 n=1 Tax=Elmerina hispida TaxID=1245649 RepID=UPI003001D771|nr:NADH dehydrogenase subunit 2 [Elmerina hispida]
MYLSIELQSFALYILATLYKEKLSSTSAGLKYFLLGGLSSCIILLGSGLVYTYTGLTNLELIFTLVSIYSNTNYSEIFSQYFSIINSNLILTNASNALGTLDPLVCVASESSVASEVLSIKTIPFGEFISLDNIRFIDDKLKGIGVGFLLIFSGFLFKIAAAPFHNWSPDVYDDSPTLVTVWLTIMPKISILIFLLQVLIGIEVYLNLLDISLNINNILQSLNLVINIPFTYFFSLELTQPYTKDLFFSSNLTSGNVLTDFLLISSLLSLILGAVVGLSQIRIKRLLAYSTINHVGFLMLALAVFSNSSIESFIFYIVQYTITNLNIFLIILALSYLINVNINKHLSKINSSSAASGVHVVPNKKVYTGINNLNALSTATQLQDVYTKAIQINISDIEYINSLKGIFYKNPILSLSLSICLFSFAGVPPLIGFFAKQQVLYSSNSAGYFFLSLTAILVSVISAFYYLKIIKIVYSSVATHSPLDAQTKTSGSGATHPAKLPLTPGEEGPEPRAVEASEVSHTPKLVGSRVVMPNSLDNYAFLTNSHSFLVGVLTLTIMIFILNPELLLNSIAIITSLILNL